MTGEHFATTACPYCLTDIAVGATTASCPSCKSVYHADCWQENGGCAVYGCVQGPAVEGRREIEIPVSYWGQENKPCPACGREILAAAVRCKHCGVTFTSARPEGVGEFQSRTSLAERLPQVRHSVIWIFIVCVVPFLAPFGAIWAAVWYQSHREEMSALPSFYQALFKIGLAAAIAITGALLAMTALYVVVRRS